MSSGTFRDSPYSMEYDSCLFGLHLKFFHKVPFLCAIKLVRNLIPIETSLKTTFGHLLVDNKRCFFPCSN